MATHAQGRDPRGAPQHDRRRGDGVPDRGSPRTSCSTSPGRRQSCSAASLRRPTPPPSSRRCASPTFGASSPARSRARRASTIPTAIALTIGLIEWIDDPTFRVDDLLFLMVKQLGIGLVIGVLLGFVAMKVFANLPTSVGSFAPVASVSVAALSYGVADVLGGSGFLAVYLVGLAVGSTPSRHRGHLVAFHEGLAFLAQVTMFVVLGLLVFPSDLPEVMVSGFVLALLLVVVVRPLAVLGLHRLQRLHGPGAHVSRLGRPARRGTHCPRHLRSLRARRPRRDDLQRGLLRRPRLRPRAGDDARVGRGTPRGSSTRRRPWFPSRSRSTRQARSI